MNYSSSLFDKRDLINEADKPSLMNALVEIAQPAKYLGVPSVDKYVKDGVWLLQQVPWRKGCKYEEICEDYVNFLARNFKKERCVVYDGYPDFTTKYSTHMRRKT